MNETDKGQILLYKTPDGESRVEVRLQNETVWLSLDQMAELFQRNKSTISRHIKNVFEEGELQPEATVAKFATVVNRGIRGQVEDQIVFYNLDMIISVGYRVHSCAQGDCPPVHLGMGASSPKMRIEKRKSARLPFLLLSGFVCFITHETDTVSLAPPQVPPQVCTSEGSASDLPF